METKRLFDIVFSVILLGILSPLFLLIAVFVGITSRGPIIFSQLRVGYKGSHFVIYKFRTLFHNPNESHKGVVHKGDACITMAGKILRPSHLDELPQLWNILQGDMSFVGPRPTRIELDRKISEHMPDFKKRYAIKPGLTGLAQVSIVFDKTLESQLWAFQYDCQYIKDRSFFLDLAILIRTIPVVVTGRGV